MNFRALFDPWSFCRQREDKDLHVGLVTSVFLFHNSGSTSLFSMATLFISCSRTADYSAKLAIPSLDACLVESSLIQPSYENWIWGKKLNWFSLLNPDVYEFSVEMEYMVFRIYSSLCTLILYPISVQLYVNVIWIYDSISDSKYNCVFYLSSRIRLISN